MKVDSETGLRMYFFVMGNISGRQQGIQAGHAALEYQVLHGRTKQYKEFVKNHKTFIVLDGGSSNDMIERYNELEGFDIKFAAFKEPDLNDSISAIAFILPEDIYDCKVDEDVKEWYTEDYKRQIYEYIRKFRLASN